jgi:hypothetical protein
MTRHDVFRTYLTFRRCGMIPCCALIATFAASLMPLAVHAQDSADITRAREILDAARRIADTDNGRLWGVSLRGPVLIADPSTRTAVGSVADSAGHLSPRDGLFVGALPADQNVANTGVTWSGRRWTMLVGPWVPTTRYERDRLIAHEIFHRIQPQLGLDQAQGPNDHLDTREGRIWLRLEWRALAEALIRDGAERRQAIDDALAFRRHRRGLFPDHADAERNLELNEGLAEYTGLVLSGLPRRVLADRAAVSLASWDGRPSFVRSFAYASGPAYGVLLDETPAASGTRDEPAASWRRTIRASSDLGTLLERAVRVSAVAEDETSLLRRAARYDGGRVIAEETARADRRARRVVELRRRFIEGPTLMLPAASAFRYSFDPNAAEALDDVGTVYESLRVSDEWGVLTVSEGGALLRQEGTRVVGVLVPAPGSTEAPIAGDGWRLELEPGWRVVRGERAGTWRVERGG